MEDGSIGRSFSDVEGYSIELTVFEHGRQAERVGC